jgi:hypothetical protein
MRAVANDAQSGLIALLLAVELATLLSRHVFFKRFLFVGRKVAVKSRKGALRESWAIEKYLWVSGQREMTVTDE